MPPAAELRRGRAVASSDPLDSPLMRKYAIWGTATSPAHEQWVQRVGKEFERAGFVLVDDIADADFVLNMPRPDVSTTSA